MDDLRLPIAIGFLGISTKKTGDDRNKEEEDYKEKKRMKTKKL